MRICTLKVSETRVHSSAAREQLNQFHLFKQPERTNLIHLSGTKPTKCTDAKRKRQTMKKTFLLIQRKTHDAVEAVHTGFSFWLEVGTSMLAQRMSLWCLPNLPAPKAAPSLCPLCTSPAESGQVPPARLRTPVCLN